MSGTDGVWAGADGGSPDVLGVSDGGVGVLRSPDGPAGGVPGEGSDGADGGSAGGESSARAIPIPWPVATATPMPSATASAPTRPT